MTFRDPSEHRDWLVDLFNAFFPAKYDAGQERHGGKLYAKPHPLDEARQEVMDQWSYVETARWQWQRAEEILEAGLQETGRAGMRIAMRRALAVLQHGNDQTGDA